MSGFYDEWNRKEHEYRMARIAQRPANLHDYQGCANDPTMQRNRPDPKPIGVQEAAGDGFEEWFSQFKGGEIEVIVGDVEGYARAAWTACAERKGK
jgi:hypothetical protein